MLVIRNVLFFFHSCCSVFLKIHSIARLSLLPCDFNMRFSDTNFFTSGSEGLYSPCVCDAYSFTWQTEDDEHTVSFAFGVSICTITGTESSDTARKVSRATTSGIWVNSHDLFQIPELPIRMRVELNQGMYRSSHECCGSTVSLLVATSLLSRYRTTSMNSSRIECHGSFISTDRFRTRCPIKWQYSYRTSAYTRVNPKS